MLEGKNGKCWFKLCTRKAVKGIRFYNKTVRVCNGHLSQDGVGCNTQGEK
jgi:hypothetical protein